MRVKVSNPFQAQDGEVVSVGTIMEISEDHLSKLEGLVEIVEICSPVHFKRYQNQQEWEYDFCVAHASFNGWTGNCSCSLDECLISKIIDSSGNIETLRGLEIGHGITTDKVIDAWLESKELAVDMFNKPLWLVCMSEYLKNKE